jgi:quinol monooxygenase YgiN
MSDSVIISVLFSLRPEAVEPFGSDMQGMLNDTRKRKGLRSVRLDGNSSDPNKLLLLSEWDRLEDYENYVAWRAGRGETYDLVLPISTAPAQREIWNKRLA